MKIHSVLFDKDYWTVHPAINWLLKHKIVPMKIHITKNKIRFRITKPNNNMIYISKVLPNKVTLVFQR
jgi:hypothetical protein